MTQAKRERLIAVAAKATPYVCAGAAFCIAVPLSWSKGANLPQGISIGFLAATLILLVFTAMIDHVRAGK